MIVCSWFLSAACSVLPAHSQPLVNSDTADTIGYCRFTYYGKLDSAFHFPEADSTFRLWVLPVRRRFPQLFLLSQKHGKWEARWFDFNYTDYAVSPIEKKPKGTDAAALWQNLMQLDILRLRDEQQLLDSLQHREAINVRDGTIYEFELETPDRYKMFSYHTPQAGANTFPRIEEYRQVLEILGVFARFFHDKNQLD